MIGRLDTRGWLLILAPLALGFPFAALAQSKAKPVTEPVTRIDPSRFGEPVAPKDPLGPLPITILKTREVNLPSAGPSANGGVDPQRFGDKPLDEPYGAFQRGLYRTAFNLAVPRAKDGDAAAQTLVAEILSGGLGVKRNEAAAAKWYQLAAEQGVPEAQFQYALLLLDGKYVKKDSKGAYALMQAAAEAGNRLAQFNFAQLLVGQEPGPAGLEKAVAYYQRAADGGLADAQYAMAQVYADGVAGKKKDDAEARRWLTRAAMQNYDTAQLDLGTWMIEGRGGERKQTGGFRWLKRAALGGNVAAQNRVAKFTMQAIGTEPDSVEAAAWYMLARRSGLVDPVMEDFLDGLSDTQTKQALERANHLR